MKKIIFTLVIILSVTRLTAQTKQAFINAGSKAMTDGDYYTAGTYFNKALAFDDDDPALILKIAETCRLYNDYRGAATWYEKYLISGKKIKDSSSVFFLADMKKYLGFYPEAKSFYQQYFSKHQNDSNFMSKKSYHEIQACETALNLLKDTVPAEINNAGNAINTVYSDFAGQQLDDSVIYFSSQRFMDIQKDKRKKQGYISKILKSKNEGIGWQTPIAIDRIFNPAGYLNCNSSISADHHLIIFSRCIPINVASYHAELYLAEWSNGKWQSPVKLGKEINSKEFTSTQACIATNGANGYIIYYSSDRPGGYGGMDLWKCTYANNTLGAMENLGPEINSIGNEITPFFDNMSNILYFSSDWHAGLGGYDIFKSSYVNNRYTLPENMGYPLNSSCNDLYYTVQKEGKEGLFTSNRPGSMYLYTQTCCYDIYRFRWLEVVPKENTDSIKTADSLLVAEKIHRVADSSLLTLGLPLKLYFDNDQPGRRSTDTITSKSYDETYRDYLLVKPEYLRAFKVHNPNDKLNQDDIINFFTNTIEGSYNQLRKFTDILSQQLASGRKITLTVQGCASPLAKDAYNDKLSKRRISSLLNYFKKYNNGILNDFIKSQSLIIIEDPAGESLASKNVSDNYNDKRKSVFHPDACLERRIEVIAIKYNN